MLKAAVARAHNLRHILSITRVLEPAGRLMKATPSLPTPDGRSLLTNYDGRHGHVRPGDSWIGRQV